MNEPISEIVARMPVGKVFTFLGVRCIVTVSRPPRWWRQAYIECDAMEPTSDGGSTLTSYAWTGDEIGAVAVNS